ncbi:helix-turn-helix domain-containing protein [Nocardia sp. NPDC004151]|uniref:helix-turn-helix domain-containing protein n=1 Tax=Nocardia sp. NPDC004151 TaxID=3364304 RepID=UPI0036A63932
MTTWFQRTPETEALVAEERLVLAATEMVHEALENSGTTKKQLADRLGVRPTEISQRLSGRRNLTLRSLAQMMHALGYDIKIEATDAVDMEASTTRIGKRVRKSAEPLPASASRSWMLGIEVLIPRVDTHKRELVRQRVNRVLDELRSLEYVLEVGAQYPDDAAVLVSIGVEAEDALSASQIGISALRTAIHTVGDRTPGWEKLLEQLVRDLRINIDPSDRGSGAASSARSDEATCG